MKSNELERNKITEDMDPFKMINKQQENLVKMEKQKSDSKAKLLAEGNDIVRMSGYDEAMIYKDIQIQDKHVIYDEDVDGLVPSTIKEEQGDDDSPPEFDPNDETDNLVFDNDEDEDKANSDELDQNEDNKEEIDDQFEIIDIDFNKQIDDYKKQKGNEVRTIHDLYLDNMNEDEVFCKDVNLLDLINTVWLEGKLSLTRYKLEFAPYTRVRNEIMTEDGKGSKQYTEKFCLKKLPFHRERYFKIPVHMIYSIKENYDKKAPSFFYIDISTKDYRSIRILIKSRREGEEVMQQILQQAMPGCLMSSLFFFKYNYKCINYCKEEEKVPDDSIALTTSEKLLIYTRKPKLISNGWKVYNYKNEFKRQGIVKGSNGFRAILCWSLDEKAKLLCGSYPEVIYVPYCVRDKEIKACSMFRTRNRIPALSYYHKANGSSIWRCAQNMPGLMNNRSAEDERFLKEIGLTNPKKKQVTIIDARSQIAAYGNRAKGGGFELENYYANCKLIFGSIENIHGVREAYKKCFLLCENYFQTRDNKKILSKIEGTGWMNLMKNILSTSQSIASLIHERNQNVVVHCSDGWDRTAQLCSLSEMLLDPFYRTLEGFEVLVEKEWISFGHKFQSRCGHFMNDSKSADERSPVFIQFLDCVHQLIKQFPTAFQFNTKLLLFLAHHVYTCKFGTFLFDNEQSKARYAKELEATTSIWTYVNDNCYDFLNPFYIRTKEVLEPNCDYLALEFWKDHFLQWIEYSEYKPGENLLSPDDHKEDIMKDVLEENYMLQKRIKQLEDQLQAAKNDLAK